MLRRPFRLISEQFIQVGDYQDLAVRKVVLLRCSISQLGPVVKGWGLESTTIKPR